MRRSGRVWGVARAWLPVARRIASDGSGSWSGSVKWLLSMTALHGTQAFSGAIICLCQLVSCKF